MTLTGVAPTSVHVKVERLSVRVNMPQASVLEPLTAAAVVLPFPELLSWIVTGVQMALGGVTS
jgi:hypothetical protein